MKEKIQAKPIAYSIIFTIILSLSWGISTSFIQNRLEHLEVQLLSLLISATTVVFATLAIFLLGVINHTCGFKHVFRREGFAKGCFALLPVMAFFVLTFVINSSGSMELKSGNLGLFPFIVLEEMTSAFVQTILFRGLLISALFIGKSSTESERVRSVFKGAALFWTMYALIGILDSESLPFMQLVNTFIVSAGVCSAYMYSRNLLSLVLVQGAWQALGSVLNLLSVNGYAYAGSQLTPPVAVVYVVILIAIVVFAVVFSRRAERFQTP